MVLHLDGKKVPKIFMGNSKIYDVEEFPEPELVKDNLLLHYDFSQGDNTSENREIIEDLSGNGNHGVLHNFNFDENSGYVENGLRFDGVDDYIEFDNIEIKADEDFTFEIQLTEMIGDRNISLPEHLSIMPQTNLIQVEQTVHKSRVRNNRYDNENYLTLLRKNNEVILINNNQYFSGFNERQVWDLPVSFSQIGTTGSNQWNSFLPEGIVSGVRIYKTALSEEEITINYAVDSNNYLNTPFPEPSLTPQLKLGQKDISLIYKGDKVVFPNHTQDGLKLWYDFSSMSTDPLREFRVKDLSGNDNDGSLANFKFDGSDGYMDKGLVFNGEGSEVNFPKMTFESEEDWTVEITLDKSTGIKPDSHLFGDKVNTSYIRFYINEEFSSMRYGRIQYTSNDHTASSINMNETSPNFVHMIISKKDGVVSVISGDKPNVIDTTIVEHEQNFDNLGFASRYSNLDYSFKGLVHSVRVYDRALTQEEITQNYKLDKARYDI